MKCALPSYWHLRGSIFFILETMYIENQLSSRLMWFLKGAFTFQSATHGFQHFLYLVSVTNIVNRIFVTIFLVLDLHSWFVWNMYKTKMTAALSHKFYVNFCFFKFDLNFIAAVHFAQSQHLSMKFLFKSRRNSMNFFFNSKKFLFAVKINWRHCLRHIRKWRRFSFWKFVVDMLPTGRRHCWRPNVIEQFVANIATFVLDMSQTQM